VVNILLAMLLGMGFYAGFIVDSNNMSVIAKQLHRLMTHGLLDRRRPDHRSPSLRPCLRRPPSTISFPPGRD
jgi:hypothetical protein